MTANGVQDTFGRPLRSLRLSVTDRCNLRCGYCMPEETYSWLPKTELLSFEELSAVVDAFVAAGVTRLRLTGGEPLLRRDLHRLVASLRSKPLDDIALTTNGVMLEAEAQRLADAGLHRLTISLDTLRPDRFERLTGRRAFDQVMAGFGAARAAGFASKGPERALKIDTVALRGINDDELIDLIGFAKTQNAEIRFIEYMDVGGATQWSPDAVISADEIKTRISDALGPITDLPGRGSAPAARYALSDGTTFGIIASVTAPFCSDCDRSRVTADGMWLFCLYAAKGIDLKSVLRAEAQVGSNLARSGNTSPNSKKDIAELEHSIRREWALRDDRGAEARRNMPSRGAFVSLDALRKNPHLEMHKRGG